ncbi:hypothetical protein FRC08_012615 [Ceratobasidium sp. 394]|nr:hypothetical protein FRC08_012615 [Ceratobasidium sp. 394]
MQRAALVAQPGDQQVATHLVLVHPRHDAVHPRCLVTLQFAFTERNCTSPCQVKDLCECCLGRLCHTCVEMKPSEQIVPRVLFACQPWLTARAFGEHEQVQKAPALLFRSGLDPFPPALPLL